MSSQMKHFFREKKKCDPDLGRSFATHITFGMYFGCCRASPTAQLVKNLPAVQETSVRFLGWEDLLEKGSATHTSILGLPCDTAGKESTRRRFAPWVGKIPWRRERLPTPVFWSREFHGLYSPWGCNESNTTEQLALSLWLSAFRLFK